MTVHLKRWGAFEAVSDGERLTCVRPWRGATVRLDADHAIDPLDG
jgi:hypothetical protein